MIKIKLKNKFVNKDILLSKLDLSLVVVGCFFFKSYFI